MQVFWDVMLCPWVWSFDILKDRGTFIFKCLSLKMKVLISFQMLVTAHPTTHKINLQINLASSQPASARLTLVYPSKSLQVAAFWVLA